jgi:RNA polymerase sigma factor (sigma-70 family)
VATSLNNLAELYRDQGQYGAAEPLYKRSLAILEKALGPQHIYVGYSLGNLAGLYKDQGQYGAAEPLYKRALAILEKALGPEHPDVALSLHNLALLYNNQGQYGAAEPLYKRALARGAVGLYRHAGAGRRGRGTKSGLPEDCSFYLGSSWLVHNFWHLSPVTLNGEPLATPEALDQQTLVEAAQADPARFLDLYDRHFHHVWAYVIRRTANRAEAEDVTSDVFRRALENLRGYEWRGIPFAAWLLRIAANALAHRWEKAGRESGDPPPEVAGPDADLERRTMLFQLVERLPDVQRRVIELRYLEELNLLEVAAVLGKTEGAVKQLQRRALEHLRAELEASHG